MADPQDDVPAELFARLAADPLATHLGIELEQVPLVLSRMDAIKGFEFDTVIADLSATMLPPSGTLSNEYWRSAAAVYCALTRARDELVIVYGNSRSVYLDAMREEVDYVSGIDKARVKTFLHGA